MEGGQKRTCSMHAAVAHLEANVCERRLQVVVDGEGHGAGASARQHEVTVTVPADSLCTETRYTCLSMWCTELRRQAGALRACSTAAQPVYGCSCLDWYPSV